jgi:hypothetical protein
MLFLPRDLAWFTRELFTVLLPVLWGDNSESPFHQLLQPLASVLAVPETEAVCKRLFMDHAIRFFFFCFESVCCSDSRSAA